MVDKFFLPNRLKIVDQKMMDNSVSEIGREYFAGRGVGDDETD